MGKYDLRKNYVSLLQKLRVECGEFKADYSQISDYNLLLEINKYLSKLNCATYTQTELNEIGLNMN